MRFSRQDLAVSQTFQRFNGVLSEVAGDPASFDPLQSALTGHNEVIDSKYRVLSLLGKGGMGSVYRVRHLLLNKEVALKTFRHTSLSTDAWQRFQREAQSIARLTHLNIVQVFDFGIAEENAPYYTMELLQGESLAERLVRHGRLTLAEALPLFIAVAGALAHAHKAGIVHRDIKPGNIFLDTASGAKTVVKVVDFGLAKLAATGSGDQQDEQSKTDSGLVFGSPLYMSPEQADGKHIDQRSDIYSFGCTLYEALTGEPPFVGDNAFATIQKHLQEVPPKLQEKCPRGDFNTSSEKVLAKLLAKDAADRYQNFDAVTADLVRLVAILEGRAARLSSEKLQAVPAAPPVPLRNQPAEEEQFNTIAPGRFGRFPVVPVLIGWALTIVAVLVTINWSGLTGGTITGASGGLLNISTGPSTETSTNLAATEGVKRHYYSTYDDRKQCEFTFPPGLKLGYLSWNNEKPVPAQGTVRVPAFTRVMFDAGEVMDQRPELWAGFRENDLFRVVLGPHMIWHQQSLDNLAQNLTGLGSLQINGANFKEAYLPRLNKFTSLVGLEVDDSNLDGRELARLTRLSRLTVLDIGQIAHASAVIQALKGKNQIILLNLAATQLSESDVDAIGHFSNLASVNLRACDLTLQGLKNLTHARNIQALVLSPGSLDVSVINVLPAFKKLKFLRIENIDWSDAEKKRLSAAIPKVTILQMDNSDSLRSQIKDNP